MVTVHLPTPLRRKLGRRTVDVDLGTQGTLRDLLRILAQDVDSRFADLASGGVAGSSWVSNVVLNDRRLELPREAEIGLRAGDHVHFIQPIAGG